MDHGTALGWEIFVQRCQQTNLRSIGPLPQLGPAVEIGMNGQLKAVDAMGAGNTSAVRRYEPSR